MIAIDESDAEELQDCCEISKLGHDVKEKRIRGYTSMDGTGDDEKGGQIRTFR